MQVTPLKKAVSILSLAILSLCILLTFPLKAALSSEEAAIKETRAVTEVAEEGLPEDFLPGTEYADTGCTCAAEGKEHSRFMINDDPYLYCLPVEKAEDGTIMVSLDHLAGVCGYTVSEENGSLTLAKEEYEYLLEKDSPWLICGSRIWALPVKPYESMDNLFVPLEFICDVLEDVDFTYEEEPKILHLETEAETDQLTLSLTEEYTKRQTSVEAATIARCGEPFTVTVTFYHDSQRWGNVTASGEIASYGTIAADRSVPFGTQYYIPALSFIKGDGIFTVQDRGGAVKGAHIDVYLPETDREHPITKAAFQLGKFQTEVYPLPEGE